LSVSRSGGAGGEAATVRLDRSGSEEAVLCRGERRIKFPGHAERVGTAGGEGGARTWLCLLADAGARASSGTAAQ